ncbi:hypothetical protein [Pseudomonas citronellolis]|uniref:hypothetical protein n=1 Tax=Pseudomonas citronellolis TaxID=53408 RepID=UPI0021C1D246|nr:hypothetical protein [Pseudomonas citronellolis]UXJ54850.1 hypothetical protein N5P21_11825 [Pseudomonas citronellolis]
MTEQTCCALCGAAGHLAAQCNWNAPGALESIRLPAHGTTIALDEMLAGYLPDDREDVREIIEAYADIQARKAVMLFSGAGLACRQSDACDWLENLEGDAWADACEEIAGAVRRQAEGAQGERDAAIAKFAETCPMTAESAVGGKPYDIELRRYYLLGWDDRAALAQPSRAPELERPEVVETAVLELEAAGWRNDDPKTSVTSVSALLNRIVGALRVTHECTMGVGSGDGQLFVHGDHASIKAAQKIVLERDAAQTRMAELEKQEPVAQVSEETFSADGTSDIITRNLPIGTKLYAAPVSQAGQVPERMCRALAMVIAALEADGDRVTSVTALRELQAALAAAPAQGGE